MEDLSKVSGRRAIIDASDEKWASIVRRYDVLLPLVRREVVGGGAERLAAAELGLSTRHVRTLVSQLRSGEGVATDIAPRVSDGGRGVHRLPLAREEVMERVIDEHYLKRQRPNGSATYRLLELRCSELGLRPPSRSTFFRRLTALSPLRREQARLGTDAAKKLKPAGLGAVIAAPLQQIQIDHTWLNVIAVSDADRQPIGRPYLTLAIDVYSRCVLGFIITLEPPSALSVGLVLARVVSDKSDLVKRFKSDIRWDMAGVPLSLLVDNAKEFHSEALRRGAELHGIKIHHRHPGKVEEGAIVERGIKTVNDETHGLPGTTFSNIVSRREYDSVKEASMTVAELERWFLLLLAGYHERVHRGIGRSPRARWESAIRDSKPSRVITNPSAFLIDFLPIERRKVTRSGLQLDYILYYSDDLRPLIERAKSLPRLMVRRNPMDISRIWLLDPILDHYIELPYKDPQMPPVSLYEHRRAVARLRESALAEVNQESIFRMITEMREISDNSRRLTAKARRQRQRRPNEPITTKQAPRLPAEPALTPRSSPSTRSQRSRFEIVEW